MRAYCRPAACAAGVLLCLLAACTRGGPDAFLASARDYMARADYPAAAIQARNAVRSQPDRAEARWLLGQALLKAGDPAAAESEFRRALELGHPRAEVMPALAQSMLGAGRADALVSEFSDERLQEPGARARFSASLGDAYGVLQRRDDAMRAYRDALAAEPGHAAARLGLAQIDAQAGRLDAALAETEAVIAADPRHAAALALKSSILVAKRNPDAARQALEQAVQADPSYLPARYALAAMLIDDGAFDRAREELAALAKAAPDDVRLAYFQSALALRTSDLPRARDRLGQILKVLPDHVPSLVLMSKVEAQSGQYASAEAHLRRVLAQVPEHQEARRLLAATYLRSGQTARAKQELQPLLSARETDPNLLLLAGEASLASGDMKQATEYYQQVAARGQKPEAAAAHTRLGQIAMASGRPDDSIRELESAAAVDPSFRQTDLALVSAHLRNGEIDRALDAARAFEQKHPDDPLSHHVLGMVHMAARQSSEARASFERALQRSPAFVPAARALAELDVLERKPDAARRRLQAMISNDPRNATLHLALAELQSRSGAAPGEVLPTLRAAVAADSTSIDARLALVSALARSGDTRGALLAAQEAHSAHPASVPVMQALATMQAVAGHRQQASETLRRIAQAGPGQPGPLRRVAAQLAESKQFDVAAEALRLARERAPNDWTLSRDLIVVHLSAGQPDEALKQARAVQASAPRNSAGWLLESQVHEAGKKYDAAARALRAGLKVDPASGLLAARLHHVLVNGGQPAEAADFARTWLADHPSDTLLRIELGARELAAKNYAMAATHYQAVLGVDPDNVVALNNLAWTAGRTQDPNALRYAERAIKVAPDSAAVLDTMGSLLTDQGDAERAAVYLGRATRIAPARADIRLNYAKALMSAGRKDEARRELEVVQAASGAFPGKAEAAALLKSL